MNTESVSNFALRKSTLLWLLRGVRHTANVFMDVADHGIHKYQNSSHWIPIGLVELEEAGEYLLCAFEAKRKQITSGTI